MRILVNALSARLGGGKTYLLNLLRRVPQDAGWRVFVLAPPSFCLAELPANVEGVAASPHLENPFFRAAWEWVRLGALARRLEADVFFSPGGLLPRTLPKNVATAVTFQNMLPFDHTQREKYPLGYRRLRDWFLERELSAAMRRADLVVFISEFARHFIEHRLGALAGRSIVIPHGVDACFRRDPGKNPGRPAWLPAEDYFLYVSFIDHYKAQLEVVRGFDSYLRNGGRGKLIFAGPEYRPYGDLVRREIAARGLANGVIVAGNIPHGDLAAVYQHACVNIFASFTENCPNILLEMMAAGRPALVSNRSPMPEFAGDAVAYFDPADPEDFALRLANLVADETRQAALACAAVKQVSGYSWEVAAARTWEAIAALCS